MEAVLVQPCNWCVVFTLAWCGLLGGLFYATHSPSSTCLLILKGCITQPFVLFPFDFLFSITMNTTKFGKQFSCSSASL